MSMGLCVMFAHSTQGSVWYLSHVSPSVMRTQGPVKRSLSIFHTLMSPFVQLFSVSESEDPLDTEHILSSWDCNWSKWGWHEERERENERVWVESGVRLLFVSPDWLSLNANYHHSRTKELSCNWKIALCILHRRYERWSLVRSSAHNLLGTSQTGRFFKWLKKWKTNLLSFE